MLISKVSLELSPTLRRVSQGVKKRCLETTNGVTPRQQVPVQLYRVDNGTIRIRDPQSLRPRAQPISTHCVPCTDNASVSGGAEQHEVPTAGS